MTLRTLEQQPLTIHPDLRGRAVASPVRRVLAFAIDALLLFVPSLFVTLFAALALLALTEPATFRSVMALRTAKPGSEEHIYHLGRVAPLLVRLRCEGLPRDVEVAVEDGDLDAAGRILSGHLFVFSLNPGGTREKARDGSIRVEVGDLFPSLVRGAAFFGTAAAYFTFFAWGRRRSTLGKFVARIEVRQLDGRPLTLWESFERFGGYLASLGTLGIGLLDLWRDANRRLAHDRMSNTAVLRIPLRGKRGR
ncbi:MAG: RDD family protein [bacterium]